MLGRARVQEAARLYVLHNVADAGVHLGGHLMGLAVILREVGHSTADPRHPEQPRLGCSRRSAGAKPAMIDQRENCPGRMVEKTNDIQRRWFQKWRLLGPVQSSPAFAILASVVGEKAPENCSALFVYLEAISKAHRTYGGMAWLRYDEQFRKEWRRDRLCAGTIRT
ncbi:hypothetical protein AB205_0215380 [Aquarana catesbeiana]|uniref:Uncharacterized protein n=1 Tax=Aquarana catesbeiana TaxID=8400 RepID=A0A2G9SLD4_AQUCT|nr:hypothetical protein AB205_0215380 [Aquarana catesbeiana]